MNRKSNSKGNKQWESEMDADRADKLNKAFRAVKTGGTFGYSNH